MNANQKQRLFMLATILVPALFLIVWWLLFTYYNPDESANKFSYIESASKIMASDGADIHYSLIKSNTGKKNPVVLFVADRFRDRDWNTKGLSTRMGKKLAFILAESGFDSIRFDNRGTGASQASIQSHYNLGLLSDDIRYIYNHLQKKEKYDSKKIALLMHTSAACAPGLDVLQSASTLPAAVIMLNCNTIGTYLDIWGKGMLANMLQKRVPLPTIEKARQEWQQFVDNNHIEEVNDQTHPDMAAFRNTLKFLISDKTIGFMQNARKMRPRLDMDYLLQKNVKVYQMQSEFDNGLFDTDIQQIRMNAKSLSHSPDYQFSYLKNSDQMMREKNDPSNHFFALLWQNLNPFVKIDPVFIKQLESVLSNI